MSKSITVIRHAKSSWETADADHQRPLNPRGCADASLIAEFLVDHSLITDAVFCSDAKRARQTLQILNTSLQLDEHKLKFIPEMYLAELNELLVIINTAPSLSENLMLIGHNPGLTDLCNYLVDDDLDHLPTCGVYAINLHVDDWQAVCEGVGVRKMFCTPRMLKNAS